MNRLEEPRGRVVVVERGLSNIASMMAGLRRVGIDPLISDRPEDIAAAVGIVLPGVGRFDAGARSWRSRGLDGAIRSFCESGRPVLAVCLGMQLLCSKSYEYHESNGLGIINGEIVALNKASCHIGWNNVCQVEKSDLIYSKLDDFYFNHSFKFKGNKKT